MASKKPLRQMHPVHPGVCLPFVDANGAQYFRASEAASRLAAGRSMYFRHYSRLYRVVALSPDMDAANEWMREHSESALLSELNDNWCVIAAASDMGIPV